MEEPLIGILYARKSTDTEDKQVRSIEIQQADMRAVAKLNQIQLAYDFSEAKSAKRPGRPRFNDAIRLIEAGKANCLITWHPDRLARNAFDGGRIIDLFDQGKLQMIQCFGTSYRNTPHEKMILQTQFVFAKYSNDVLSERVSGAIRDKIRRGEYPGKAYLGYINHPITRKLVPHRRKMPIVREAFERYATGTATLDDIRKFLFDRGIKTRRTRHSEGGKMPGRCFVSRILSNPIYHGAFDWAGGHFQGTHPPIVSKVLFDKVQAILEGRYRCSPTDMKRTPKAYLGVARCGKCGYAITVEVQKGHIYYRCTRKSPAVRCTEPFIRESALDSEIRTLLSPYRLAAQYADGMLARLAAEELVSKQTNEQLISMHKKKLSEIAVRFSRVKEALFRNLIDPEDADLERREYLRHKRSLDDEIAALTRGEDVWLEPMREWILRAKNIGQIVETGSPEERATAAKEIFGSNLVLESKKARGEAVKPWSALAENELPTMLVSLYDAARTYFQRQFLRGRVRVDAADTSFPRDTVSGHGLLKDVELNQR